ncbi:MULTISPECIES: membrane protein insertase YidC [unclassified Arcicella]|uniref:membrane protein insertase YidC n=1 Tax=unclassified Arcicella TaxID=2644986 RepID=UPI00285A213D|nr:MULTISPECIES: membrane protein insertase YidC [unclassified Arcicella]MDR6562512.1 YidC/Oxa1 family membrane protein insertase [Arcicella sp. BE51]MDR6812599.1 YidC/Oxa1 family membrane protein insertase [Arcicella sp. BE140]MDR6823911.1 YidC/Oxa1 family membrane protein insertase [Arcicella sp. BE139]
MMDKNQVTGLLLIMAMLLGYQFFLAPKVEPEKAPEKAKVAQTATVHKVATVDSVALKVAAGDFASAAIGTAQELVLENKDIKVVFSTLGGKVKQVLLKNYETYNSFASQKKEPLVIFDEAFDKVTFDLPTTKGNVDLNKLYFTTASKGGVVAEGQSQKVSFTLNLASGQSIEQTYTLGGEGFLLDQDVKLQGLDGLLKNESAKLNWIENVRPTEKDLTENRKATVNYLLNEDEDFDQLAETPTGSKEESLDKPLKWVSFKKKYFLSGFITKNAPIQKAQIVATANETDSVNIKTLRANMDLDLADLKSGKGNYQWYFGPNDYNIIKNVAPGFGKNVKLSYDIFLPITRYVFVPLFNVLETVFSNYGLLIIALVLIIKFALLPLTYKSYVSMAKMRILQPELNAIKEKVGDDAAAQQQAQMKLYGEVGVSPLSGCVPVLATMPVLMAVFMLFPNLINLRQQSFLWANDLSTFDSIATLPFSIPLYGNHISLFTLLMTLSSIAYGYYNNQNTPDQTGQPIDMKKMAYVTPVIFMFVMNSLPAGMSFYYFVSNLVTIGQQIGIRKFVDEDKIKAVLEENRKKIAAGGVKKSRFSEYISKQMKAVEETQKTQQADPKKKKK